MLNKVVASEEKQKAGSYPASGLHVSKAKTKFWNEKLSQQGFAFIDLSRKNIEEFNEQQHALDVLNQNGDSIYDKDIPDELKPANQ